MCLNIYILFVLLWVVYAGALLGVETSFVHILVCWRSSPDEVENFGTIFGLKPHEKLNPKQGMGTMELGRNKNITSKEGHVSIIRAPLMSFFPLF
jgi:hypothetical protein